MSPDYYAECTCDINSDPGPHRPYCATEQTPPTEQNNDDEVPA
ncbi:hypothetical protein OG989_04180 [Micromonospora sp. NBC_01740]|nr:hypothetical protein OG989_04180 [Micromonospora sp. NBC_01740]